MIVQIRGGGFVNKGAELMLIAVARWLRDHRPGWRPVIDYRLGTRSRRKQIGLDELYWHESHRYKVVSQVYNGIFRLNARRSVNPVRKVDELDRRYGHLSTMGKLAFGLNAIREVRDQNAVIGPDLDGVLDISGFAYGDQWGARNMLTAAAHYEMVRQRGGKVVLLPQQLGPFRDPVNQAAFTRLSESCDLIFARDARSYECAKEIIGDSDKLKLAPDFTILLKGELPDAGRLTGRACIIPNFKMLEQTSEAVRDAYPIFLGRCIRELRRRNLDPFILIHEQSGRDHAIIDAMRGNLGQIDVVDERDPLRVKGIIGESFLTIGSRFHGLVSALSQSVPSLGTGWSHKYNMLFQDYGCPENIVEPLIGDAALNAAVDRITSHESRTALINTLRTNNERCVSQVMEMWRLIGEVIG